MFTDYVHDPIVRYKFGEMWVGLVLGIVVFDAIALLGFLWMKVKGSLEACIARRAYDKKRAELIASGKLIIKKELTEHEKRVIKYK